MNAPKLTIGDCAMRFGGALEKLFPECKQQHCWKHKSMNVLNKLLKSAQHKAKKRLHEIWQAELRVAVEKAIDTFFQSNEAKNPKVAQCQLKDHQELINFYDFPAKHWQILKTSDSD